MVDFRTDMQIVELDSFESAFPVRPDEEDAAKRRFMTLFTQGDAPARLGGTSYVCKAYSYTRETFALKRLLADSPTAGSAKLRKEDEGRLNSARYNAFYEEYRNHLLVSNLQGFPRVYGFGMIGNDPVIVMEWIEGVSLRELMVNPKAAPWLRCGPTTATIGLAVLDVLENASRLDATLVHRDLTPANIMIRTNAQSLEEQVEQGKFDVCLIDFGSAMAPMRKDATFTINTMTWRMGTPEYAPPEMLTQDMPHIGTLRASQAIDVFALCSVLYELYAGRTPWQIAQRTGEAPHKVKLEEPAGAIEPADSADAPLVAALMQGLQPDQDARPSVSTLATELEAYLDERGIGMRADQGRREASPEPYPRAAQPGTRLAVASKDEGGKRAGEAVDQSGEASKHAISRRTLIACAAAIGTAAVGGALAMRALPTSEQRELPGYATVDLIYEGPPLYPAMHLADSSWVLREPKTGTETLLKSSAREPGKFVDGLIKSYDEASAAYGFLTLVQTNENSSLESAWAIAPSFSGAGDFCTVDGGGIGVRLAAARDKTTSAWGFVGDAGSWTVEARYSAAGRFSHGVAAVRSDEMLWGAIGRDGRWTIEPQFLQLGTRSEEGLMAACLESSKWGFVDDAGAWAIPYAYACVRRFTEGLAACKAAGDDTRWGFIDATGAEVIPPTYANALPFGNGLAPVQDSETRLWGLIRRDGTWEVAPAFLSIGEMTGELFPAHGSPAGVYDIYGADADEWRRHAEDNGDLSFAYGYLSPDGTWAIAPIYGDTLIRSPEQ